MEKTKVKIIEYFDLETDPEGWGDYYGIVVEVDNFIVAVYGDDYHDKGLDKALGFIDAMKSMGIDLILEKDARIVEDALDVLGEITVEHSLSRVLGRKGGKK